MLGGFVKVIYYTGMVIAALLVLYVTGTVNSKGTHGMAAVGAGLGDVIKWAGTLLGQALSHL